MKPSTLKKARKFDLDTPLFVRVMQETDGLIEFDAAYNREEIVKPGEKQVIGVYELVRLEEVTGVETVVFKEIK